MPHRMCVEPNCIRGLDPFANLDLILRYFRAKPKNTHKIVLCVKGGCAVETDYSCKFIDLWLSTEV